jgi:hypothetical protein
MRPSHQDRNGTFRSSSGERTSFPPFRDDSDGLYDSGPARFVDDGKDSPPLTPDYNSEGEDLGKGGKERRGSHDLIINTGIETGTDLPQIDETEHAKATNGPVSWVSLPRKDQLIVLMLARLSEPLTQTSLGSYLYYQLQSFDPSLPESTISYQAGIIGAAFPATQFVTAMLWGRFSDSEYGGRKRTIYFGLVGTMLSIIGFGFSSSFAMAVAFRCLGGILNGNVGVMRTMISEIVKKKKYQSRAFLLLPMTFNTGVIIGPILGKYPTRVDIVILAENNRRCTRRSVYELPVAVRTRLYVWWKARCTLDEAVSIRPTQSDERCVPSFILTRCSPLPRGNQRALQAQTRPWSSCRSLDKRNNLSSKHGV